MNKSKWKDIGIRAGKTFLQAFFGAITIDVATLNVETSPLKNMLLAAVAAGLSAVMNLAVELLKDDYY